MPVINDTVLTGVYLWISELEPQAVSGTALVTQCCKT
jgi:hypothetical protein